MIIIITMEHVSEVLLHVNTIISVINVNGFHLILRQSLLLNTTPDLTRSMINGMQLVLLFALMIC